MNAIDVGVVVVVLLLALRGFHRGFVRSVFGFAGWLGGFIAGMLLMHPLAPAMAEHFGIPLIAGTAFAFLAVFFSAVLVCAIVGWFLSRIVQATFLDPLDRAAGLALGVVEGVAVCGVLLFIVQTRRMPPEWTSRMSSARIAPELASRAGEVVNEVWRRAPAASQAPSHPTVTGKGKPKAKPKAAPSPTPRPR
jgi:membrane protein required for colicin V production